MDNWIVFNREVVTSRIPELESEVGSDFDVDAGKIRPNPLDQIIESTVAEIRTAIASCSRNRLHPETTRIPLSLVNDACALVSYYFATRMPGVAQTVAEDPRYQTWRAAKEKLEAVASCKVPVEDYATGVVSGGQSAAAQIIVERPDEMRFSRGNFGML